MTLPPYRYAIYFCPKPESALGRFGLRWLASGEIATSIGLNDEEYLGLAGPPRRYGFHGTLKPPFRLASGLSPDALIISIQELAGSLLPIELNGFHIKAIRNFIAMVPISPPDDLSDLASRCVQDLDDFREPLSEEEITRRRQSSLSRPQNELLEKWGYPYVLEEFRFHLTLTGSVDDDRQENLVAALADEAGDALGTYCIDDICICVEPTPGAPFELLRRFPLGGA